MSDDPKLTKFLNFRVPETFRNAVDDLANDTRWEASDICRLGLLVFWPDIEAIVRVSEPKEATEQNVDQLREIASLLKSARRLGLNVRSVLAAAVEEKLARDASRPTGG